MRAVMNPTAWCVVRRRKTETPDWVSQRSARSRYGLGMGPGSLGRWGVVENGSGANDFLWVLLRSWRLPECANSELPAPACWETRPARAARDVRDDIQ